MYFKFRIVRSYSLNSEDRARSDGRKDDQIRCRKIKSHVTHLTILYKQRSKML